MYEERPIFIPADITEEAVESVARKNSGSSVPGGTDSEALQGWLLKFGKGTTQGYPIAMIAYWIGILPLINNTKREIPDVTHP